MAQGNYGSVDVNPRGKLGEVSTRRKAKKQKLATGFARKGFRLVEGPLIPAPAPKTRRSPSAVAEGRSSQRKASRTLSSKLTELAASTPRTRGIAGAALSGGLSGAALGAALGEAIGAARKERRGRAKERMKFAKERLGSAALEFEEADRDFRQPS